MTTNNGILDLSPYMSSLITEAAFMNGGDVLQNPEVYVLGNDGKLYQYHQFSLGRSAMTKIADTPIRYDGGKSLLKPYLKPLVNDKKIPLEMLDNIVEFFKRVMKMTGTTGVGHGDYEAMAHIVWNRTTESYRVAIPRQKVSKAAVTYNWDHVKEDEEVIFDIHSHNSMDAFFSGTDERDDATYVGISGVAGRLDTVSPKLIWRFNAYKTKQSMTMEEIFVMPEKSVSPEVSDWMENVEVQTYRVGGLGYQNPTTKVYGGGSLLGAGSGKSLERNPREDSWNARFHGEDEEAFSAFARTPRSQASVDILGEDTDSLMDTLGGMGEPRLNWDETADELVATVYSEDDDELNAAVAKRLAESVTDNEVLYQEGIFPVTTASEARKVIERLHKDFNIRSA